jgi:hypothetical protein
MFSTLVFGLAVIFTSPQDGTEGVIDGVVVNATRGRQALAGAEVVLRVRIEGEFVSVASTTTQADGSFHFEGLPTGIDGPYLAGANQDGVHFPGPRIRLTADQPQARIELSVFESVAHPNPLIIETHDIRLEPSPGSLRVTETMLINNPTLQCYVGQPHHHGGAPVTLKLSVPADFERITFDKEAFGRRFAVINEKLVTGIPWPPGKRELRFTYVIANQQRHRVWKRPLDLPCSHLSLTVATESPDEMSCNLEAVQVSQRGEAHFESSGALPAGHLLELELGRLPVPMTVYARQTALFILTSLVVAISIGSLIRQRKVKDGRKNSD